MQKIMTRNELYQLDQEILSMKKESPALALLLEKQIKSFYQCAGFQLNINKVRFSEIQEKYIQKDEHGNFMTTGEGEQREWKYINGKLDLEKAQVLDVSLVKQKFNEECTKFFSQKISFEW